jgi:hypothetical protein
MAQTENGEKIFDYYCEAGVLEFASDWMDFFIENNIRYFNLLYSEKISLNTLPGDEKIIKAIFNIS